MAIHLAEIAIFITIQADITNDSALLLRHWRQERKHCSVVIAIFFIANFFLQQSPLPVALYL